MMSDHWKLLANILGTPGPADPVAKETTKKKPEPVAADEQTAVDATRRDPLADIVVRKPDPVVPGFVVPEPETAKDKPAPKKSAWDSLIGSLGIKPAQEPSDEVVEPIANAPTQKPSSAEIPARPASTGHPTARKGFGSGLVDDTEDVAWPSSTPTHDSPSTSFSKHVGPSEPEQRRRDAEPARRDESTRRDEPGRREESARKEDSSRRNEPNRGEERRPARDSGRTDTKSHAPRSGSQHRDERPKRRGFGDGLIDWDHEPDDEFVTDDAVAEDLDKEAIPSKREENFDRPRSEDDRPRGRGRRGGSRGRGRRDERADTVAPVDSSPLDEEDSIGWHREVDDDLDEPVIDEPPRHSSPRSERPSRDTGRETEQEPRRPRRNDRVADEPTAGEPRRGRRGQRQMMSGAAPEGRESVGREPVNRESVARGRRDESQSVQAFDFIEDDDDLLSEELGSPVAGGSEAGTSESPGRPRRRRGRRGRGGSGADRPRPDETSSERGPANRSASAGSERGSSERSGSDRSRPEREARSEREARPERDIAARKGPVDRDSIDDVPFAAELDIDAIDSVELDDDHEDSEEVERIRRGRRRGGRGRGDSRRRSEGAVEAEVGLTSADEPSGEIAAPKHRNVPTWLDTVNLLVEPNIERHRRSGPPRTPQGRGGRR